MSEVKEYGNITTLEDLFLSHEFGKAAVVHAPAPGDTRFGGAFPRASMVPLVIHPSPGGHASTTHLRSNRMVAVASGVAAALLLAVGFISGTARNGNGKAPVSALPPTTSPTGGGQPIGGSGAPTSTATGPGVTATGSGAGTGTNPAPVLLSSFTDGGGAAATQTHAVATPPAVSPAGTGGVHTTPPATSPGTPAPTGTVLSPVVSLVGQVVTTTGSTVSGVSSTLGTAVPAIAPVTGIVGGLGGTLTGLGDSLVTSA